MWGCLDTGYAVRQWCKIGPTQKPQEMVPLESGPISSGQRQHERPQHIDMQLKVSQEALHGTDSRRFTWRNLVLFSRLFEAHFLPIHLFLVLLASAVYSALPHPISQCRLLTATMEFTSYLRGAGFACMTMYFVVFYESYHQACIQAREREMKRAGLYEEMAQDFSHRQRWTLTVLLDYVLFPVAGTIFGSVPLLQAIISHFWTEKLVYLVSAKPVRVIARKVVEDEDDGAERTVVV